MQRKNEINNTTSSQKGQNKYNNTDKTSTQPSFTQLLNLARDWYEAYQTFEKTHTSSIAIGMLKKTLDRLREDLITLQQSFAEKEKAFIAAAFSYIRHTGTGNFLCTYNQAQEQLYAILKKYENDFNNQKKRLEEELQEEKRLAEQFEHSRKKVEAALRNPEEDAELAKNETAQILRKIECPSNPLGRTITPADQEEEDRVNKKAWAENTGDCRIAKIKDQIEKARLKNQHNPEEPVLPKKSLITSNSEPENSGRTSPISKLPIKYAIDEEILFSFIKKVLQAINYQKEFYTILGIKIGGTLKETDNKNKIKMTHHAAQILDANSWEELVTKANIAAHSSRYRLCFFKVRSDNTQTLYQMLGEAKANIEKTYCIQWTHSLIDMLEKNFFKTAQEKQTLNQMLEDARNEGISLKHELAHCEI